MQQQLERLPKDFTDACVWREYVEDSNITTVSVVLSGSEMEPNILSIWEAKELAFFEFSKVFIKHVQATTL